MFTLLCVLVNWLILVDLLVIFSSSKYYTTADTPASQRPF